MSTEEPSEKPSDTLRRIDEAVRALAREGNQAAVDAVSKAAPLETRAEHRRILEALLFATSEPLDIETLRKRMPHGADVSALLAELQQDYAGRGVNLARVAGKWRMRTAPDLAAHLAEDGTETKRLSQAALETLAIIAYHQPVTRAEIEEVRGVGVSKGTLDHLLEIGWVRPRGRRRAPGRPVTYATTDDFLTHFDLDALGDLPGKEELKAAGLLDPAAPDDFFIPDPGQGFADDEDPLEADADEQAAFHTDYLRPDESEAHAEDDVEAAAHADEDADEDTDEDLEADADARD